MTDPCKPSVAFIGAGAIGGLFGGTLSAGGLDVTLVDRNAEHVAAIRRDGLRIVGYGGDRAVPVRATTDAAELGPVDIVVIQTKSMSTVEAARASLHMFGPETVAISFQNGLGNEEAIEGVVGQGRVLGGLTAQGAVVVEPGVVRNFGDLPTYLGELGGGLSARAERIAAAFTAAGVDTHASADIRRMIWKKLLGNVALSPASGATDLTSAELMAIPELRATCTGAMYEALAVAQAAGIALAGQDAEDVLAPLTQGGKGTGGAKSSLAADLARRRPTEIDYINGAIARLGKQHGIPTPINDTLIAIVKGIESHYVKRG